MTEELEGTLDADPTSEQDTPDQSTEDTPPTTEAPAVDWEARYKEAQAWGTRLSQRATEYEEEILRLRANPAANEPPADETPREKSMRLELEKIQRDNAEKEERDLMAQLDPTILSAFQRFQRVQRLDPSPRGMLNAFRDAIDILSRPSEPAPAAPATPTARAARQQAVTPVSNRAEGPGPDLAKVKAEAKEKHTPGSWLVAAMREKGWG